MAETGARTGRLRWLTRHVPTRETVHENRLLRPLAPYLTHPSLWRMTPRSVPRGVAVGLFVAVIIPFMHTLIAVLLAIPTRANVAVAAIFTWVINPFTIPPMYYAAYRIGRWELHADAAVMDPTTAVQASGELARFLFWIHHASGPIALGVLTIAIVAAATGYFTTSVFWRLWISRKVRRRRRLRSGS